MLTALKNTHNFKIAALFSRLLTFLSSCTTWELINYIYLLPKVGNEPCYLEIEALIYDGFPKFCQSIGFLSGIYKVVIPYCRKPSFVQEFLGDFTDTGFALLLIRNIQMCPNKNHRGRRSTSLWGKIQNTFVFFFLNQDCLHFHWHSLSMKFTWVEMRNQDF